MKTSCHSSILLLKGGDFLIININRLELLSTMKRAASIAPADAPLDVLKGVLLEADSTCGKLTVTATNLDVTLQVKLPCSIQEDGAFVIRAKLLLDMLQRLPSDTVQILRFNNQGLATLKSEKAGYDIEVWETANFPKLTLPFPEDTVAVSGIPSMAQKTVFATVQDSNQPLLKCVNLMFTKSGLRATSSNGKCIVSAKGDETSTGNIHLLIPALSFNKLAHMCTDKDIFRVGTTGKQITFFKEDFLFTARLMEGSYIDTELLLSTVKNAFTVLTDIQELRSALSSVMAVMPEGKVKLTFQNQRILFSCTSSAGRATTLLEVLPLTGAPRGEHWYSIQQLNACLKALSGTVTLGIAQGGMLTLSSSNAYYLQSAMRAQDMPEKSAAKAA